MNQKRRFTPEFKKEAVGLVTEQDYTVAKAVFFKGVVAYCNKITTLLLFLGSDKPPVYSSSYGSLCSSAPGAARELTDKHAVYQTIFFHRLLCVVHPA